MQSDTQPSSPLPSGDSLEKDDRDVDVSREAKDQAKLPHERDQSPDALEPNDDPVDRGKADDAVDDRRQGRKDTGLKPVVDRITERQERDSDLN